ncbi:MAG: hypothetical protein JXB50_14665, partial [Spirochaetes bacterium]|nr:hypothetical protein [Spirochaetota bacterium]
YILKVFLRGVEMYGINKFLLLLKSAEKKWDNKNKNKKFWYKKIKVRQLSLKKQINIQYDNKYTVIIIKLLN